MHRSSSKPRPITLPSDTPSGCQVTPTSFAPWPSYGPAEIEAVTQVLQGGGVNYWTGSEGKAFEAEFAVATGRRHGIALANGTVALELALHAFGIGVGDEVVTSSRTFIASASAAVMRGATPVIADVDRDSQNVTAETLAAQITPRTRAFVVVHLAGWPCDMPRIMQLAAEHGIIVIEDCAQACGASLNGSPVGSFGHAAAFSFCQDKIITTGGEGGMLVLDDDEAFHRAWAYKDHGKSYEAVFHREHPPGYRWLHESFGTNMRMTEPQAAIGRIQLAMLEDSVAARNRHAAVLHESIKDVVGIRVAVAPQGIGHAYYKFYAFVEPGALRGGWCRDRVIQAVVEAGVPCFSGSCPEIYREGAFCRVGLGPVKRHPVAAELGETSLMLLVHPTLSDDAMKFTGDIIKSVMAVARR